MSTIADLSNPNNDRAYRVIQLQKMLDLLVHASECRLQLCQYPNCLKLRGLFSHGMKCKVLFSGGCVLCKKMWRLLQLHARACKQSECPVPRCRDLKEHTMMLQLESDMKGCCIEDVEAMNWE